MASLLLVSLPPVSVSADEARAVDSSRPTTVVAAEFAAYSDTNAVTVISPSTRASVTSAASDWSAAGRYVADIVTAASVDILSSASPTWTEVRHEAGLDAGYEQGSFGVRGAVYSSSEPDYLSLGAGAVVSLELAARTFNPSVGYAFAHDTAGRVGTPFSVFSQDLARHKLTLGAEFVLDRASTLFVEVTGLLEIGDASKPYRFVPLFAPEVAARIQPGASLALVNQLRLPGRIGERVPGERVRVALAARYSRRYRASTAMLFQRLYADDWGLTAATSEGRYVLDVGRRLGLWVRARAHVQTGVWFWERAYSAKFAEGSSLVPRYRTGDRELGPLLSASGGTGLRYAFGSAGDIQSRAFTLQFDEMLTSFRDALYLDGRLAHLVLAQVEVGF